MSRPAPSFDKSPDPLWRGIVYGALLGAGLWVLIVGLWVLA